MKTLSILAKIVKSLFMIAVILIGLTFVCAPVVSVVFLEPFMLLTLIPIIYMATMTAVALVIGYVMVSEIVEG